MGLCQLFTTRCVLASIGLSTFVTCVCRFLCDPCVGIPVYLQLSHMSSKLQNKTTTKGIQVAFLRRRGPAAKRQVAFGVE